MRINIATLLTITILTSGLLLGCQPANKPTGDSSNTSDNISSSAASKATIDANKLIAKSLDLTDQNDFNQAHKGLIATAPLSALHNSNNEVIWNNSAYDFVQGKAPDTVNPSLWRQAKLNNIRGLFKVTDNIYQLRGFDLANMSIIVGDSGWIIVDPLTSKETARNALQFAQLQLGKKPIKAIIFTHPHMDHFGGVLGLVSPQQVAQQHIRIIAPQGFMEAATSENIIAGIAMARRSAYMYGKNLPRNASQQIGSGLGTSPAFGTFGIIKPTELVSTTNTKKTIDGIDFVFQNAAGSEAPVEITFYLPQFNAFCGAEIVSRTMHNLYTLRGAQVRNALSWSNKIDQALHLFGHADIYFGSHHWPIWGNDKIKTFLGKQRDLYKFIHDQSVRLMNQGLTSDEIAEQITLPTSLSHYFANRGYYGNLKQNAKAVYQYYMGWFDGNPAHLDPLPATQSAARYITLMGGAKKVLSHAQSAFDRGEYRWVAELVNHLVFADPHNKAAKNLLARSYQQLAYQTETAPWRNVYLSGAQELSQGVANQGIDLATMADILTNTPVNKFFTSMSVRLNSEKAEGKTLTVAVIFTDLQQKYLLELNNSVLHHHQVNITAKIDQSVDATLTLTHELFVKMLIGQAGIKNTLFSDDLSVDGSVIDLVNFFMSFDKPNGQFNMVTP